MPKKGQNEQLAGCYQLTSKWFFPLQSSDHLHLIVYMMLPDAFHNTIFVINIAFFFLAMAAGISACHHLLYFTKKGYSLPLKIKCSKNRLHVIQGQERLYSINSFPVVFLPVRRNGYRFHKFIFFVI